MQLIYVYYLFGSFLLKRPLFLFNDFSIIFRLLSRVELEDALNQCIEFLERAITDSDRYNVSFRTSRQDRVLPPRLMNLVNFNFNAYFLAVMT